MINVIGHDGVEDFKRYDTNSDGHLEQDEMLKYLNDRFDARGQGKVDDTEKRYIGILAEALSKDGILDQADFDIVSDTFLSAEEATIGRNKNNKLPDNMLPRQDWGKLGDDIERLFNRPVALELAQDYLKYHLIEKTGISDAEKLYLFNRLEEIQDSNGNVDGTALQNLINAYMPVFNTQNVFK